MSEVVEWRVRLRRSNTSYISAYYVGIESLNDHLGTYLGLDDDDDALVDFSAS